MARINLLPWREERRRQQRQEFFIAVGLGVGLTVVIMAGIHLYLADRIEYQEIRNRYLKSQIAVLDRKIREIRDLEKKRDLLVSKMEIIQRLQSSRPEIVHLFDALARTVPEGVHLNKIVQKGDHLTVTGIAQSNARVSAYMRNIESSPWMEKPQLKVIESKSKSKHERQGRFTLEIRQRHPKAGQTGGES
ncbi:type IV pilus assembly protein PilN [Methylomarinovum tepidoasis]|uniref:Type IV pilus assembly protein PilN n=1 Tax=Methylomarinovum tepidoasis TaxID=2840183 RepID=A0AAU9CYH2_9GAMM|nr:PilN domain-containing protein [Methylomarinovum sp. IN45]BCX89770.1 type IV pilus assembly protein PilN [Methylomarinovum sp. IN45]